MKKRPCITAHKIMRKLLEILAVLCLLLVMAGCKKTEAPQASKPEAAKPKPIVQSDIENTASAETGAYSYDTKGRRDPFFSVIALAKQKVEKVKKKDAPPVESYDISELKLIAVVWDNKQYHGMLLLPDGKSFTVREGTTVGIYNGKVDKIMNDRISIKEYTKDYKGELKSKVTILKLRKEEEE